MDKLPYRQGPICPQGSLSFLQEYIKPRAQDTMSGELLYLKHQIYKMLIFVIKCAAGTKLHYLKPKLTEQEGFVVKKG